MRICAVVVVCLAMQLEAAKVFERRTYPLDWKKLGESSKNVVIEFTIALKQRNVKELETLYWKLADPDDTMYGKWLTKEQIWGMIAPSWDDLSLVMKWATSFTGVKAVHFVDSIRVSARVEAIHQMFPGGKMHEFYHPEIGVTIHKLMGPLTLPDDVHARVDMITGISDWPLLKSRAGALNRNTAANRAKAGQGEGDKAVGYVIPQTIRRLYNIPDTQKVTNPKSTQMAIEYENYPSFTFPDLQNFAKSTAVPFTNVTRIMGKFGGLFLESTLDVQYIVGIGIGATTAYWTVSEWMYEYTNQALNITDLPLVHSISYGWPEAFQCVGFPGQTDCSVLGTNSEQYIARTNTEFMKLGANGISIIVCSQDEGAPSEHNIACGLDNSPEPLWPIYPGTSPYVLSVGSTAIIDAGSAKVPSCTACSQFQCATGSTEVPAALPNSGWTTGGGFSNYTAMPDFQKAAVAAYLANTTALPPSQYFKAGNRAYPDIATVGTNILIQYANRLVPVDGTSASTPMIAGMVTLLNDLRLAANKPPLGPIAPLLYKIWATDKKAFNDVNDGNNKCTTAACCKYGYQATNGFDAVTGLGTPNFKLWMEYVQALP